MAKELKAADELKALLDERVARYRLGSAPNAQWIKVVPVDPEKGGANWRVAHSGVSGDFAKALDRVTSELQQLYDLSSP